MKLFRKRIKLIYTFIIAFSIVSIPIFILYTYFTANETKNLSKYAIKLNQENSLNISNDLFLNLTRKISENLSLDFKFTARVAKMFAKIIIEQLVVSDKFNLSNNSFDLKKVKEKDFFSDSHHKRFTTLYWGNTSRIPACVLKEMNSVFIKKKSFIDIYSLWPELFSP